MVRRSIFLITAAVVMLYFSIIIFMLNPLHGTKNAYYSRGYMNNFAFRHDPPINWCSELRWRNPPSPSVVALVSYPGSGNTWLRYLLQQVTGIVTGSIYMDYGLRMHGFPAENVTDGSVLVVKTHEAPPADLNKFQSAILLIRNPRNAILADFNRLHKGHIGTAPKSAFKKKTHEHKKTDWATYVSMQLTVWETLHSLWLNKYSGLLHIVFYEVLVRNTNDTLHGILDFLNYNVTEAQMNCALSRKEGIYRRKKKFDFDPFTPEMYKALDQVRNKVLSMVSDYKNKRRNSLTSSSLHTNKIM